MSHLIETIRIENGIPVNLDFHEARYRKAMMELFGITGSVPLSSVISCPCALHKGIVKCRIVYGEKVETIVYEKYLPRTIRTLKLVEADSLEYSFKYADRKALKSLVEGVEEDDVLIVKKGLITDISFANVALLKNGKWFTPREPLLEGTRRASMLKEGLLICTDIPPGDLQDYEEIRIINAMIGLMETEGIMTEFVR